MKEEEDPILFVLPKKHFNNDDDDDDDDAENNIADVVDFDVPRKEDDEDPSVAFANLSVL